MSVTSVAAGTFWALSVGLCLVGAIVALTKSGSEFARTLGAVLCIFGMLCGAVAMAFTVRRIAQKKASQVIDEVQLNSDIRQRLHIHRN